MNVALHLGRAYERAGRFAEAAEQLTHALEQDPNNIDARAALERIEKQR